MRIKGSPDLSEDPALHSSAVTPSRSFLTFRSRYGELLLVGLLLAFATLLRLHELAFQSLWCDELITADVSNPSASLWSPIWHCINNDVSPPLFYFLLSPWQRLMGSGEFTLRLVPALFGIAGVLATYALGRELFSRRVGMMAALIVAMLPMHIYYSQELRSYSLLYLGATLSYFFLLRLLRHATTPKPYDCAGYWFTTTMLLYTHYFSLFILASQFFLMVWLTRPFNMDGIRKLWRLLFRFMLLPGLLYLPWLPFMYQHTQLPAHWIPRPSPFFWIVHFRKLFLNDRQLRWLVSGLILIYFLPRRQYQQPTAERQTKPTVDDRVLLCLWLGTVLTLPYLLSLRGNSLITFRNMIALLPALAMILAAGLDRLRPKLLRWPILLLLLTLLGYHLGWNKRAYYRTQTKEQWRQAVQFIMAMDPRQKYPVHGVGYAEFYFRDVFKTKVDYRSRILTIDDAQKACIAVEAGNVPGFWILDGHRRAPHQVHIFLEKKLNKAAVVVLHKVDATLYVPKDQ